MVTGSTYGTIKDGTGEVPSSHLSNTITLLDYDDGICASTTHKRESNSDNNMIIKVQNNIQQSSLKLMHQVNGCWIILNLYQHQA